MHTTPAPGSSSGSQHIVHNSSPTTDGGALASETTDGAYEASETTSRDGSASEAHDGTSNEDVPLTSDQVSSSRRWRCRN